MSDGVAGGRLGRHRGKKGNVHEIMKEELTRPGS